MIDDAPASHDLVKALFDEVADLEPAAAEARLAASTAPAAVVAEVRSLLDWDRGAGDFLETAAPSLRGLDVEPLVGQSLGSWRVVDVVGQGGMGVVDRAERADDAFTRQAAIKVIGPGADAARVVERFRRERQTLADLDHRNIARLIDGGSTPAGQPYFVMEFVDGEPIDRYCDARGLSIDERLELFVRVCNGVQYAHENLVVHRDIKPDNILVTADVTPKLLDFGVARLLSRPDGGDDADTAATWLMTPDFASPEQMAGRASATSTDVYSLGVVLYVLLTGERPYRLRGSTPAAILAALDAVVVRPPSAMARDGESADERARRRATTAAALSHRLEGDLDAIALKALARDPRQRYSSVADLLRDIRAFRTSWPVTARPPSFGYVTGKFARRHTKAFAAAAILLTVIVGGVAAVLWQASVAARERVKAERRFNDVRRLANAFMFDVNDTILNVPGTMATRELIVKTTVEYLDSLAREAAGDAGLQRELARAWTRVGDVQGNPTMANMGDTAGAMRSYRRAVDLAEGARRVLADDVEASRALAGAYRRIADVMAWAGDTAGALPESQRSKALYEALAARPGAPLDDRLEAAVGAVKLGDLLGNPNLPNLGRAGEAGAMFDDALAAFRRLDAAFPDDVRVQRFIGLTLERVGTLHETGQRWPEAEAAYRESFAIRKHLADAEPAHRNIQRDYAIAFEKLGKIERAIKGPGAGIDNLRGALAQFARLAAVDPADANAARSVAVSREVLASALLDVSHRGEARTLYEQALAAHEALAARDAGSVQARCDTARLMEFVGDTFDESPAGRAQACARWRDARGVLAAIAGGGAACSTGGPSALAQKLAQCR
jgi:non-specific serine/threonine protein kinase/serine/threonine-protein kinase